MGVQEHALTFDCLGQTLVGVISLPAAPEKAGVLIIVGGPQYRAGSHRQFVQVARALAEVGFAVLRFDYRGMGDSAGEQRSFESIDADISAALSAFERAVPGLERVALFGLCDGASAALRYLLRSEYDRRVGGLMLLNPWVRTTIGEARTRVRHYYRERLLSGAFWRKLFEGRVALGALGEALAAVRRMVPGTDSKPDASDATGSYVEDMARAAAAFMGPMLLVTSGRDFTANEFLLASAQDQRWLRALSRPATRHVRLPDADHTFSSLVHQRELEAHCVRWLRDSLGTPG